MKWRNPASIMLGLVSAAHVFGLAFVDVQDISPGEIAEVHARDPRLFGAKNCELCHGTEHHDMTHACLDCHQAISSQLEGRHGFHGVMEANLAAQCVKCHCEHHGRDFQITNSRSFQLAGITDPTKYDHAGLDFQLTGKHITIGCDQCHPNANATLLAKGEKRFIGLEQNCTSCHEDVHQQAFGQDCASCHGQEHPFPTGARIHLFQLTWLPKNVARRVTRP